MGNNCLTNNKGIEELKPEISRSIAKKSFYNKHLKQEPFNPFKSKSKLPFSSSFDELSNY